MKKEISLLVLFALLSIMSANLILAEENSNVLPIENRGTDHLVCKIDFMSGAIDSLSKVGVSSLEQYSTKLKEDKTRLESLASEGNRSELKIFLKNTLEGDIKKAREAVHAWRKENYKNLSKEQKQTLKEEYDSLRKSFEECEKNGLQELGKNRINAFNNVLDNYQKRVDRLEQRGLDVSGLKQILADAKTSIIDPLQNDLTAANDSQSIKSVLKKYCLFNGCLNGINFHLAAKFEAERLNALIKYLENHRALNVTNDTIARLKNNYNTGKGLITEAGTTKYNDNGKTALSNIKKARETLKERKLMIKERKE